MTVAEAESLCVNVDRGYVCVDVLVMVYSVTTDHGTHYQLGE